MALNSSSDFSYNQSEFDAFSASVNALSNEFADELAKLETIEKVFDQNWSGVEIGKAKEELARLKGILLNFQTILHNQDTKLANKNARFAERKRYF